MTSIHRPVRIAMVGIVCGAAALIGQHAVFACTAFCAVGAGQVLVGNNEDWNNPRTKLWFVPAKPGAFGRVYVGFDDRQPQGGMNAQGLWFDGFAAPAMSAAAGSSDLPHFPGNIVDTAMAECRTVEEVVRLFSRYNRAFLAEGILMFADASGDAVSIERNAMVRKSRQHFVQTNFHQSRSDDARQDGRFRIASTMLEDAGNNISIDLSRRILSATHQKGAFPTLYSNIYDLRSRTMRLYYFHDFERVVTLDLAEELRKGARVIDIPALFPRNAAAEAFAARRSEQGAVPGRGLLTALLAVAATLIVITMAVAIYGWIHGGRRLRLGIAAGAGAIALSVVLIVVTLSTAPRSSAPWIEFSIGPASGQSVNINASTIRSDGITVKTAVAAAYGMPAVRVIGPAWLDETRYSINAVAGVDAADSFRSFLRQELKNRLRLDSHVELRPFDVFVLTATDAPRLERSQPTSSRSIWINERDMQLQDASMESLASALQAVVRRPVIDETGITGSYNLEFGWGEDRVGSVTTVLHDRFGLRLSPGKREMEALIVDRIQRDPALLLFAQVGRMTRPAPQPVRHLIARVLAIH